MSHPETRWYCRPGSGISHSFRLTAPLCEEDHDTSLSPLALKFGASFARKRHPKKGKRGTAMGAPTTAVRTRHDLQSRLASARKQTDELFAIVREEAMYDRPIPERHRVIFYLGHVEAFDWNLLAQRAFGLRSLHETFDKLF